MLKIETHIAWRYLIAKKRQNAINIISGVSCLAVAVVTAAMICVLSVMNGFGEAVEQMFRAHPYDVFLQKPYTLAELKGAFLAAATAQDPVAAQE